MAVFGERNGHFAIENQHGFEISPLAPATGPPTLGNLDARLIVVRRAILDKLRASLLCTHESHCLTAIAAHEPKINF